MDYAKLKEIALEVGFDAAGELDVTKLEFLQEVRDMCASDKCHNYGRSWSCPPAAPSLEEMRDKVLNYSGGVLVQTVTQLEDNLDFEGMMDAARRHGENMNKLYLEYKSLYPEMYAMGAGGCQKCPNGCTYPDEPCRFPDTLTYSMEACGLVVSNVCTDNGIKYNHGKDTLAYTSCFLFE